MTIRSARQHPASSGQFRGPSDIPRRLEGERETEVLHSAFDLFVQHAYHALSMDAIAFRLLAGCPASTNPAARIAAELGGRLGRSEVRVNKQIYARAQARGEIEPDRNLDLVASVLPGALMHYEAVSGLTADRALIERIIDNVVMHR